MERFDPNRAEERGYRFRMDTEGYTPVERLEAARTNFEELVADMAPDIDAGRWDLIIGDDVSGRIPALILADVIKRRYADKDIDPPNIRFIALGQHVLPDSYREYLIDQGEADDGVFNEPSPTEEQLRNVVEGMGGSKRALFVTDNIGEGNSIRLIMGALEHHGIASDVASISESAILVHAMVSKHREQDPDTKGFGLKGDVNQQRGTLHVSSMGRPRFRQAVGVEKYDLTLPITEGVRQHDLRDAAEQGDVPVLPKANTEVAQLRQAAKAMAADLYRNHFSSHNGSNKTA